MGNPSQAFAPSLALRLLGRSAMIVAMLAGGLLCAGISQAHAQSADLAPASTPAQMAVERARELVAATGGPASAAHLVAFAPKASDVEVRDDDVEDAGPDPSAALNAAQLNGTALGVPAPNHPGGVSADPPPPAPESSSDR